MPQNIIPRFEIIIAEQSFQILKEGTAPSEGLADGPLLFIDQIQNGVVQKDQQVQRKQERGEMLIAMSEVVFNMIALGLENIIILVFDLPACAPIAHNGFDGRIADSKIGIEGILVETLARIFPSGNYFAPVDFQG